MLLQWWLECSNGETGGAAATQQAPLPCTRVTRPIPDPARPTPVPSRSLAWAWVWEFSVRCLLLALGDSSPCIEAFRHTHTSCYWTRTGPGGNLDAAACLRDNLRNVHIKRMQEEPLANRYRKQACTESGAGAWARAMEGAGAGCGWEEVQGIAGSKWLALSMQGRSESGRERERERWGTRF